MHLPKRNYRRAVLLLLALIVSCCGYQFVRFVLHGRHRASSINCKSVSKATGLAIHHFLEDRGTFPPASMMHGDVQHGWRVLIAEYFGGNRQWKYDFDQPWDSPQNLALQVEMPLLWCPSRRTPNPNYATSYVAITGPNCVLRDDSFPPRTLKSLNPDTIMLVETKRTDIHWMSPVDLVYEDLISDRAYAESVIGGPDIGGGHFVTVDGRVGDIDRIGLDELLRRAYVPDTGEEDWFDTSGAQFEHR